MSKKTKKETVYVLVQSDTYREGEQDMHVCASKEDAEKQFKECLDYYWNPEDRDGTDNNGNTYEECLEELRYDDGYDRVSVEQLEVERKVSKQPILDAVQGLHEEGVPNKTIQKQLDAAKDLLRSYEPTR